MRRALSTAAPYAVFVFLALVSWNRWMEPFVDSGRELMVPWRVAGGEALYRDVHFHHGPLAPWAGAVLDRVFGRSTAARTAFAAAVALAALEALRRLCSRWMSEGFAALAASLAVALSFFLRPGGWLFPFSFDTAIAVAALMAGLAITEGAPDGGEPPGGAGDRRRDAFAALALLLALLSRPELGVAGAAALAWNAKRSPARLRILAGAPLLAAGAVYGVVSLGIPIGRLVDDGWMALFRPPRAFQNVYRAYAGLDQPGLRLAQLGLASIVLVLAGCFLAASAAITERVRRRTRVRGSFADGTSRLAFLIEAASLVLLFAGAFLFHFPPEPVESTLSLFPPLVRVVPAVVAITCAWRAFERLRAGPRRDALPISDGALLLALLFSLRLLLAAGYAGPYNAFFLPLPVGVAIAAAWAGARSLSPSVGSALPRLVAGSFAIFFLLRTAAVASSYRSGDWGAVATPAGTVTLPEPEASTARLVLADLAGRLPRGGTLSGFPEAGFFGYALGARNPLPAEQFWPGHFDPTGERRLIQILQTRPPDVLLLIDALAVGEGTRAFGTDYSVDLGRFVEARFRPVAVYGPHTGPHPSIGDPDFFVEVRVPAGAGSPRSAIHP